MPWPSVPRSAQADTSQGACWGSEAGTPWLTVMSREWPLPAARQGPLVPVRVRCSSAMYQPAVPTW